MQRFTSQKKMKILTFSTRRQNSLNGVLDETTTANTRGRSSRAHARLCKFTSGSRPSSSRRPILRSLITLSDGCYAQFPVISLPPIWCTLSLVRLAVIDSDFHKGDETVLNFATVCYMVKTVLAGVNIVERGLFSYSPDWIIPIKPSLYGV